MCYTINKWKRFRFLFNKQMETFPQIIIFGGIVMKRAGAIMLASLMCASAVVALTACGGDYSGDTATTKTVKVWVHKSEGEDEGRTYRAIEEAFNEQELKTQDGRTIVMKMIYKNDADSLRTSIAGENITGGLPDVFAVDSADVTYYAHDRLIVPIDEYLTDEIKNDYVASVIDQSTYDGKLYALSGMDAPGGLYYNKTLLKSVGYEDGDFGTISDPWSWKDVMEAMDALKAAGKKYQIKLNLGFGGNEGQMYLHSPLVYSAGGTFANAEGKTVGSLNS